MLSLHETKYKGATDIKRNFEKISIKIFRLLKLQWFMSSFFFIICMIVLTGVVFDKFQNTNCLHVDSCKTTVTDHARPGPRPGTGHLVSYRHPHRGWILEIWIAGK